MLVTLLPMVMLVRLLQSRNAYPDAGDAVGYVDARQASAVPECVIPDAGDAVGYGDARQASASTECVNPDAGDAVGNGEVTAST